jgi:FkbM family methyltransferase
MNLKDNGLSGTVLNKGIAYGDRNKLLHASRTSGGHVLLTEDEAKEYIDTGYRRYEDFTEDVETITMEEFTKDLDVIDLAKWDCEGAEVHAFRNMTKETAAKFRTMVGEYHLWGDGKKILQASPLDIQDFWDTARRKFPHLLWNWGSTVNADENYGKFQAWPKAH